MEKRKLQKGDIVDFVYNGGSNPGERRTIILDDFNEDYIYGRYSPNDVVKTFCKTKVSDFQRLVTKQPQTLKRIFCSSIGEAADILNDYYGGDYIVVFDKNKFNFYEKS